MTLKRLIIPFVLSLGALTAQGYSDLSGRRHSLPQESKELASFLVALFGTILYGVLYLVADSFRLWRRWPAWMPLPLVGVGIALFVTFIYSQGSEVSGFQRPLDAVSFFGGAFLASLPFGLPYIGSYYISKPRAT